MPRKPRLSEILRMSASGYIPQWLVTFRPFRISVTHFEAPEYSPCAWDNRNTVIAGLTECFVILGAGFQPPPRVRRLCDVEGCSEDAEQYYYPDGTIAGSYCVDHAHDAGFCHGCGDFWGGVESFDFGGYFGNIPGLCENCSDLLKAEIDEWSDDGVNWPYERDGYVGLDEDEEYCYFGDY